jgi:hypothetical protein
MIDPTYTAALEAALRRPVLGPVPCHTCGAWVEYVQGAWVALTTDELHDCGPFIEARADLGRLELSEPGRRALLASLLEQPPRLRRPPRWRRQMAHLRYREPRWVALTARLVYAVALVLGVALVIEAVARYL